MYITIKEDSVYEKKKLFSGLLFLLLTVMLLIPVSVQAAAAKKPGTVKLSSIKAVDYNKINIKWKKPSGKFTNYCIYYREKTLTENG